MYFMLISYARKLEIILFGLSGFVIPKGWRIYVYTREINYDPFLYPEPSAFNPWRWTVSLHWNIFHFRRCNIMLCYIMVSDP